MITICTMSVFLNNMESSVPFTHLVELLVLQPKSASEPSFPQLPNALINGLVKIVKHMCCLQIWSEIVNTKPLSGRLYKVGCMVKSNYYYPSGRWLKIITSELFHDRAKNYAYLQMFPSLLSSYTWLKYCCWHTFSALDYHLAPFIYFSRENWWTWSNYDQNLFLTCFIHKIWSEHPTINVFLFLLNDSGCV